MKPCAFSFTMTTSFSTELVATDLGITPEFSTAVESGCPWKTKGKNLAAVEKKKHVAVETTPSFITLGFFSLKNSQSGFFLWD